MSNLLRIKVSTLLLRRIHKKNLFKYFALFVLYLFLVFGGLISLGKQIEPFNQHNFKLASISLDHPIQESTINSVRQIMDVQPSDWGLPILRSLQNYGMLQVYPDQTFRGNNAATRYEAINLVHSFFKIVSNLLTVSSTDSIGRAGLADVQKLQEEFAAQLATLRGRIDSLESKIAELQAK